MDRLTNLFEKLKEYVTIRIELLTLNAGEQAAALLAKLVSSATIIIFCIFVLLFLSLAGAVAVGQWLNNYALGFLLMGVFFLLVVLIAFLLKKRYIEAPLMNVFIRMLFKNINENKHDE